MDHVHNADPTVGPVCSHLATHEVMEAIGLPTPVADHGNMLHIQLEASQQVHAAWGAGRVRICTLDPAERRRTHG